MVRASGQNHDITTFSPCSERWSPWRPWQPGNFTTVLAGILMAAPVAGFLPMRALRFDLTSRPMPGRMKRPFFLVSFRAVAARVSINWRATLLLSWQLSARCRISLTRPIFCTNPSKRVYITAWGCEIGSGRRNGLQAPGAGGL